MTTTSTPTATTSFEIIDSVGVLRLDDGKANAIGYETLAAIDTALESACSDAKALVIIGRPGRFSAGFDLRVVSSGPDAARDLVAAGARTAMRIYGASVPVVAACTGHALAFGAIMLLASDVRIGADTDAKIGLNEVSIGMSLPIFAIELARDRLDPRYFTRSTALATLHDPAGAAQAGFLDEVVAPEDVEQTAMETARMLGDYLNSTGFALTRRTARGATIDHIEATLDEDLKSFAINP